MGAFVTSAAVLTAFHVMIQIVLVVRALIRPHREPASRIAWIVVIVSMPAVGIVAYLLLGETSIGRRRAERVRAVLARMPVLGDTPGMDAPGLRAGLPDRYEHVFRLAGSVNGFAPIGGNAARLMPDSDTTIDEMVADIDGACDHVHLVFYIWLTDRNGTRVAEALMRAAGRGVACRAMVDGLGSRAMLGSDLWGAMGRAGVRLATSLPIGNPLLRPLRGRIDLRNHRKVVVIDDRITYCGSQNCADPEFRVKAKFAPWVDAVMRFEGPVARQNQHLFAGDWMAQVDDDLDGLLRRPLPVFRPGFTAQAFGTGPTARYSAMPEMFETLMYSAREELVITTPYYVPTESMQAALCCGARRGVRTTIVYPARNDSWIVAAASRSYYRDQLDAGVRIFEYVGGLLHTKSLTVDGEITLIGSANMDRRSFELNYENNMLVHDAAVTAEMRARQEAYIASANEVTLDEVDAWPFSRRLWNNAIALLGPVL
jgi:cardiolipin synthase